MKMFFYGNNCHYFTKRYVIMWTVHCPAQDICMVICFTGYCFGGIRKRLLYMFVIEKIYYYIYFFIYAGRATWCRAHCTAYAQGAASAGK